MTNLTVSTTCNQKCPYCFAIDYLGQRDQTTQHFLDLDNFEAYLAFLDRSGVNQIRLLGGEPTLHPQFTRLIELAGQTGKRILVFSNGLMPEMSLDSLEALPIANCTVLINVNAPEETGEAIYARQCATIKRLGRRVLLGYNIYQPDFAPDFLLSIIADADCQPSIRLGLAHPCLSGRNRYIRPQQYVAVAQKLICFARRAANSGVFLEFDCGFVRCMFSNADLETLKTLKADVGWRCNPILDVGLNGEVIYCYPLAELGSLQLTSENNASALRQTFIARTQSYRQAGVFKECSTCSFKSSGECAGGCLAATVRRFRHTPFRLNAPVEGAI